MQTAHHSSNGNVREIGLAGSIVNFYTGADSGTSTTKRLSLTADGKGRSLFTAAAWFSAEGAGTPSFHQSHNCSSIESMGSAGYYRVNFDTDFANGNYAVVNNAHRDSYEDQSIYNITFTGANVRYVYVQDSTGGIDIADFSSLVFGA